jgi:hypothetical protein
MGDRAGSTLAPGGGDLILHVVQAFSAALQFDIERTPTHHDTSG